MNWWNCVDFFLSLSLFLFFPFPIFFFSLFFPDLFSSRRLHDVTFITVKIQKKYHSLGHKVILVQVEKDRRGLGISLAGHKDRNRMAVFVCGLNPKGAAHKTGEISVGDEILEVNFSIFYTYPFL